MDQGGQFTSDAFISVLESYGIRISMDSKNRALDNIYMEWVWRTNNRWTMLHQMKSMIRYLKPPKHQRRLALLESPSFYPPYFFFKMVLAVGFRTVCHL